MPVVKLWSSFHVTQQSALRLLEMDFALFENCPWFWLAAV